MTLSSISRTKRIYRGVVCLVSLMVILNVWTRFSTYYPQTPLDVRPPTPDKYLITYKNNYWKPEKVKKILFWTPFFDSWDWAEKAKRIVNAECPDLHVQCDVTTNRSELSTSRALVFHATDYWKLWATGGLPETRHPSQVWVMFTQEATPSMWLWFPAHEFNWTMSYRRDSTIGVPYGSCVKKTTQEIQSDTGNDVDYFANKTKMAVIQVSNCHDNARRYKIVHELSKHIEVDQFGYCPGKVVCDKGQPYYECAKMIKQYKFYLAFENSFCRDYISEKYWQSQTDRQQIPVIATSKSNIELLPPHSYLNVFDFPSLKELAEKMTEIGNNATLYNSYFQWKKYYKTGGRNGFCVLCEYLHQNRTAQSYDLDAWMKHDSCSKPSVSIGTLCVIKSVRNQLVIFRVYSDGINVLDILIAKRNVHT